MKTTGVKADLIKRLQAVVFVEEQKGDNFSDNFSTPPSILRSTLITFNKQRSRESLISFSLIIIPFFHILLIQSGIFNHQPIQCPFFAEAGSVCRITCTSRFRRKLHEMRWILDASMR